MNKNKTYARILLLIPVIIVAVLIVFFVLACILEHTTDRGFIYSLFAFVSIIGFLLIPIPCAVLAIIGLVFATKAKREEGGMGGYIAVAITEIVLAIIGCGFWLFIIFVIGPSV